MIGLGVESAFSSDESGKEGNVPREEMKKNPSPAEVRTERNR